MASLPVTVAGPWMAYLAGEAPGGWSWDRMVSVALHRTAASSRPWMGPLYVSLALVALAVQVYYYRVAFDINGRKAWAHYLTAAAALAFLCCGLGVAAAVPLRAWLE